MTKVHSFDDFEEEVFQILKSRASKQLRRAPCQYIYLSIYLIFTFIIGDDLTRERRNNTMDRILQIRALEFFLFRIFYLDV